MTAQQTLWKRANLPNFPGLDKTHCVLAVTHLAVSSSVSASSTLGISCPYSDFIVSPLEYICVHDIVFFCSGSRRYAQCVRLHAPLELCAMNTIHNRLIDTISPRLSVVVSAHSECMIVAVSH